jgi:hypothetical protein
MEDPGVMKYSSLPAVAGGKGLINLLACKVKGDDRKSNKQKRAKSHRIRDRRGLNLSSGGCFEHLRVPFGTVTTEDDY